MLLFLFSQPFYDRANLVFLHTAMSRKTNLRYFICLKPGITIAPTREKDSHSQDTFPPNSAQQRTLTRSLGKKKPEHASVSELAALFVERTKAVFIKAATIQMTTIS